jgi:hypothetical protein
MGEVIEQEETEVTEVGLTAFSVLSHVRDEGNAARSRNQEIV